ncbi:MAG: potassium channel family protein, partial [Acidimicrobiia bacterium]
IFAVVYTVVARTNPDAFAPPQPVVDGQTDLYYFSFVTVSSLGYGDISPTSDLTRVLAPIEAIIGAILIAALVGRIVGVLAGQATASETQRQLESLTRAVERLDPGRPQSDPPGGREQGPGSA